MPLISAYCCMMHQRITYMYSAHEKEVDILEGANIFSPIDVSSWNSDRKIKGFDWISLVFAHPFSLNSEPLFASANLMMELAQLIGASLFKTNGWAKSSPYPVSPFDRIYRNTSSYSHFIRRQLTFIEYCNIRYA